MHGQEKLHIRVITSRCEVVVKSGHHVRRCTNPESENCLPSTNPEAEGADEFIQRLLAFLRVKFELECLNFRLKGFKYKFLKVKFEYFNVLNKYSSR